MTDTWQAKYDAAWTSIRTGLGALGDHVDDARAFVGDRALLDLLHRFEPGEVIIAIGIQIAAAVIGPDGQRELGARTVREEPLEGEVEAAHRALVETEGDERWRRILPPDARMTMMRDLYELKAREARGERMPWENGGPQ